MSYYSEGNVFVNVIRLWRSSCWVLCGAWHGKLEANDAWTNGWSHKASQISFMSSLLWKYMNAMLIWSKAIDQFWYIKIYYLNLAPRLVGIKQKKINVLFITECQDNFFCFISPSLAANYEFSYIETDLLTSCCLDLFFVCLFVLFPFHVIPWTVGLNTI